MRIIGQPINLRYLSNSYIARETRAKESASILDKPEAVKRIITISEFALKHGCAAAMDAYGISQSSCYDYTRRYKLHRDYGIEIEVKSTRPRIVRKPDWDKRVVRFIVNIRNRRANLGKTKIKYYLDKYCVINGLDKISTGTIQNIINSYPNKLRTKKAISKPKRRVGVLRKPAKFIINSSGECIALDSMEFRADGLKAYILTAIDDASGMLYACGTYSHSSRTAKMILEQAMDYLPYANIKMVLTDNGSEFAKEFSRYLKECGIIHYHTYPKTPKQNARCERVNRTVQDEFMIKYGNLLFNDLNKFNKELLKYLRWYNFERVHARFDNKMTPFERHRELEISGNVITSL